MKKLILLITDGANAIGRTSIAATPTNDNQRGRVTLDPAYALLGGAATWNLAVDAQKICQQFKTQSASYASAVADTTAAAFNARFTELDASGRFAGNSLNRVIAAFEKSMEVTLPTAGRNVLGAVTPWELFRNLGFTEGGTNLTDLLVAPDNGFGLDGRPVYDDLSCRLNSSFSPYGRIDDLVQVGGQPVAGVAPFANVTGNLVSSVRTRLDGWLTDACGLAKQRGVEIKIIYLTQADPTEETQRVQNTNLELLRQCIDEAGGDRNADIYESPTAANLSSTFRNIFTVRRNLRFLN